MVTIKEAAKQYVKTEFKNISDLKKVSVNIDIQDKESTNNEGKTFTYKYFMDGNDEIRVPYQVLGQLKAQLKADPNLEFFRVMKEGAGKKTTYTVITTFID